MDGVLGVLDGDLDGWGFGVDEAEVVGWSVLGEEEESL